MKLRDLERTLRRLGFHDTGKGSKHAKWSNGRGIVTVPRHTEINEYTAKGIIRDAEALNMSKAATQEKK